MPPPLSQRIAFLGAGQMARALALGWVRAGLLPPEQLVGADVSPAAAAQFAAAVPGARVAASNRAAAAEAEVVFLCVKPQHLPAVYAELAGGLTPRQLAVSICAGVPLAALTAGLGSPRVVRVMPNTPCLAGCGASAFALGPGCSDEDAGLVERLLAAVGIAVRTPEAQLDAVTGLSGSGPAFVYLMIEALADGGVLAGLPRATALQLAAQTVKGAAEMVLATGRHPGELKDQVASPAGTTIAGLAELERRGVRGALLTAVGLAARRSAELGAAAPPAAGPSARLENSEPTADTSQG